MSDKSSSSSLSSSNASIKLLTLSTGRSTELNLPHSLFGGWPFEGLLLGRGEGEGVMPAAR